MNSYNSTLSFIEPSPEGQTGSPSLKMWVGTSLPRYLDVGTSEMAPAHGLIMVRTDCGQFQIASRLLVGAIFIETLFKETECHGVTFRFCHFQQSAWENLSLRQVRFEHCTFADTCFKSLVEPTSADGVIFDHCYFDDAGGRWIGALRNSAWAFSDCVFSSGAIGDRVASKADSQVDAQGNQILPVATVPIIPVMASAPERKIPAPPNSETRKPSPNRFDQLELSS